MAIREARIGWRHLNKEGQKIVAKLYGHDTPEQFEINENHDLYPEFIAELEICDNCSKLLIDCECAD